MTQCVDSHVHFWDGGVLDYPWLKGLEGLGSRYLPADYDTEVSAPKPSRWIFVEADCDPAQSGKEVDWIDQLAAGGAPIVAIVAQAKLDQGKQSKAAIEALQGRTLVRGVRHMLQYAKGTGYCSGEALVAGARLLAEAGLAFDLCCREDQLADVGELVGQCPGTQFVLDHAGKPSRDPRAVEVWKQRIARLSDRPNVVCKLSGMSGLADPTWGIAPGVRPYFEHLLAHFGGDRLLYGSDWPVVKLTATLTAWQAAVAELLAPLPEDHRRAILNENAARVYRLN